MPKAKLHRSGIWTITVNFAYKRRTLTLGSIEKTEAEAFAANINLLVSHRRHSGGLPRRLESFVLSMSSKHRKQLGELGLLGRFDQTTSVKSLVTMFLEDYDELPEDVVQEKTKTQFRSSMNNHFPGWFKKHLVCDLEPKKDSDRPHAKPVFSKTAKATCRKLESWQREYYSKSTWSKANGRMRQVGKWAVEHGFCDYNPFSMLKKPGEQNDNRNEHIETEWVEDAMSMCLDPDTRLVFALGRFAGMRTPSEARTLKPQHVNFESGILEILDSKKRVFRKMPLFDQIREELIRHRKVTGWKTRFVLTPTFLTTSDSNNFRKMKQAVARAQLDSWVRLRQNLRSSCENDLLRQGFDERLVTQWLGHEIKTSRKHYQKLIVTDFQAAIAKSRASTPG